MAYTKSASKLQNFPDIATSFGGKFAYKPHFSIGMEMELQEMKLRLKIILSVWKQIISMYLWKVEAMR
jgi:hypothetical protein